MPNPTTPATWQAEIDEALKKGQPISPCDIRSKKLLCDRLQAIDELYHFDQESFTSLLQATKKLLERGVSCDFITSFLNRNQPLHHHASPQESGLINALTQQLQTIADWSNDKQWLNLFLGIYSPVMPIMAAEFILCLSAQKQPEVLKTLPEELLYAIELPTSTWSLWANNLSLFQQLTTAIKSVVQPLLNEAIYYHNNPQKINKLLTLLVNKKPNLPKDEHAKLLIKWWKLSRDNLQLTEEVSEHLIEKLSELGTLIADKTTNPLWINFLSSLINSSLEYLVDLQTFTRAEGCMDKLKALTDPAWQKICCDYASTHAKNCFDSEWLDQFYCVLELPACLKNLLTQTEQSNLLTLTMRAPDVNTIISELTRLQQQLEEFKHLQLPYSSFFQNSLDRPKLQAILQVIATYKALNENQQQNAQQYFKSIATLSINDLKRTNRLFKAMAEIDASQESNPIQLWATTYELAKNPNLSIIELQDKIGFMQQFKKVMGDGEQKLLDAMLTQTTPIQRKLLITEVFPLQDVKTTINPLWQQLKSKPSLNNALSLGECLETQQQITRLAQDSSGKTFSALLNFDDPSQRTKRQTMMQAICFKTVYINNPTQFTEWWTSYINALKEWISAPLRLVSQLQVSQLNKEHHDSSIKSLQRVVTAVRELQTIASKTNAGASPTISQKLITQINTYQSSYQASWWKSRDRKAAAKKFAKLTSDVNKLQITYKSVFETIAGVMTDITNADKKHHRRNAKGYSRLYDICLQLLAHTIHEAMINDPQQIREYAIQIQAIIDAQKASYQTLNLKQTAFQHLDEVMQQFDRPYERSSPPGK